MAQEESLATASGLYDTLLANEIYYTTNRQNSSMMYSDLAIFSPNVVFSVMVNSICWRHIQQHRF